MANDWKECSLGDVIELKRGYDLPQKERLPGDVPLVSSSGVTDTHAKAMVKGPGVVTGRYGTLGQVFYVEQDFWPLNTTLYVRDFKGNDPRFINYFLRDVDFLAYSDKAAVPGLNRNHLHQARVRIPTDPTEQRAIAHILGTLDDKIELNRKQNETLEAMARALFKAWFVDFEPVRAKLNLPSPSGRGAGGEGISSPPRRGGEGKKPKLPTDLLDFARELRRRTTDAETLLWRLLRGRQMAGAKFRRQHPFPPYVLDFYCHEARLAIELDGGQHNESAGRARDARRDEYLAERGIRVLRFWNHEVLRETEAVLEAIHQALVPSPPAPLPEGEGSWGALGADGVWQWPQHILDLFPDRLVDSELGEIPEGWEVTVLGDFVDTVKGRSYKSEELAESTTALVTLKSFARGGGYRTDGLKSFTGKYKQEQIIEPGEIVIACTDVTQAAEIIGRAAIVRGARRYETLVASLDTMILRPRNNRVTRTFLYHLGRSDSFAAHMYSHTTGTTVLHLGKEAIPTYRFVMPPQDLVAHFDAIASNALARIDSLEDESERLVALRDTLLPKLISGELRIKDAEKFMERVT